MTYQPRAQVVAKRHERMAAETVLRLLALLDPTDTGQDTRIRAHLIDASERICGTADLVMPKRPR